MPESPQKRNLSGRNSSPAEKGTPDQSSSDTRNDSTGNPTRTLIMGCGYLGYRVAVACQAAGNEVYATTRRPNRAKRLANDGFHPVLADWTDRRTFDDLSESELPRVDRILVAISYDRKSRPNRFNSQVGGLHTFLEALQNRQGHHGHLCYISTTGVYHQTDGRWVDEASPTHPQREGGRVHLQAESRLRGQRDASSSTILRLAGIYGPGRVPRAADVIAGRPIRSIETGYLNLIHVEDAAAAVMSVWDRAGNNKALQSLYVIADDRPVVRSEFYREIARQCDAPEPRFQAPDSDAPVLFRSESNKRVWNRRMKRDLVGRLKYPTYREGLADVLR